MGRKRVNLEGAGEQSDESGQDWLPTPYAAPQLYVSDRQAQGRPINQTGIPPTVNAQQAGYYVRQ
jgi:hypothetical protein